jgi:hypothetical protein
MVGFIYWVITVSEVELWLRRGSNLRPSPYEDAALPLSYAANEANYTLYHPS